MTKEEVELKLKANGGRITKSRRKMANIFLENPTQHFSIEELTQRLEDVGETNVATIYNNLSTFVDLSIVKEFTFNHKKHYELTRVMHAHFICQNCGKIKNLDIPTLNCIAMEIERDSGDKVLSNCVDFFGVCADCLEDGNIKDIKSEVTHD